MSRTPNGFPLYAEVDTVKEDLLDAETSRHYTILLLDLFVKDTPFQQKDIRDLHEYVQDFTPVPYVWSTIRRRLSTLKREGLVKVLDDESPRRSEHVYYWTRGNPKLKDIQDGLQKQPQANLSFPLEKPRISPKDPGLRKMGRLFYYLFS